MLRFFLVLLCVFPCTSSLAQKDAVSPLKGRWQLRYMEVNREPIWSSTDSSVLFHFAQQQIGSSNIAEEDSLVLFEKVRSLDPNFRRTGISFFDGGRYEFIQADADDPFREPLTEKGSYQLFRKEHSVILTPDSGATQTLQYLQENGCLKLYGTDEQEGFMLFDKQ